MNNSNVKETPMTARIMPYTSKALHALYGINEKTFRKWLEPFQELIGEKRGIYYNLRQVAIIFDKLGTPGNVYQFE